MAKRKAKVKPKAPEGVRLVKDRDGTFSLRGLTANDIGTIAILSGTTVCDSKHPFIVSTAILFMATCGHRDNHEPGMAEWNRFYGQGMDKLVIRSNGDSIVPSVWDE